MKSGNKKQKGQFVGKHKDKSEYQLEKAAEDTFSNTHLNLTTKQVV